MHLTVAFLLPRVTNSTIEDWIKLRRLMYYLHSIVRETSFMSATNLHAMHAPINVSWTFYTDCKSYTSSVSLCGIGVILSKFSKQKLNTTSLTKAELVGISNYLLKLLLC